MGANPTRSRHCKRRIVFHQDGLGRRSLSFLEGKALEAVLTRKSGNLPRQIIHQPSRQKVETSAGFSSPLLYPPDATWNLPGGIGRINSSLSLGLSCASSALRVRRV